jgi:hypothetical protein
MTRISARPNVSLPNFEATEGQVDTMAYELRGLMEEEIDIVRVRVE